MKDQRTLINAAVTGMLALGISASSGLAHAADQEKCWGVTKAGQNACNSNPNQHACAGHSKLDNDPNDFIALPKGSCLKIGGMLEPGGNKAVHAGKL